MPLFRDIGFRNVIRSRERGQRMPPRAPSIRDRRSLAYPRRSSTTRQPVASYGQPERAARSRADNEERITCEYPHHHTRRRRPLAPCYRCDETIFDAKSRKGSVRGANTMSPETIRNRALECTHLAQTVHDPQHRSVLLNMAHSWADLANTADQFQLLVGVAEKTLTGRVKPRARIGKARPVRRRGRPRKTLRAAMSR